MKLQEDCSLIVSVPISFFLIFALTLQNRYQLSNMKNILLAHDILSFVCNTQVGDLVSVIDMPSSEDDSLWMRGKRGFEVGFFPSDCVEMIKEASLKKTYGMPSRSRCFSSPVSMSIYSSITSPNSPSCPPATSSSNRFNQPQTSPSNNRSHTGKLGAFLRFFVHLSAGRDNQSSSNPRSKHETTSSPGSTFGFDLTQHLISTGNEIPVVLDWCSSFIERNGIVEGIYRLSGVISNIDKLRQTFNDQRIPEESDTFLLQDVHSVASLLKLFFREMPDPLLTYDLYDDFIKALQPNYPLEVTLASESLVPEAVKVHNLKRVVKRLPVAHKRTLEFLMRHLNRVSTHCSETGMTAKNVAIVWAPNLLQSRDYDSQAGIAALHLIGIQAVVTEYLIRYVDKLFQEEADQLENGINTDINDSINQSTSRESSMTSSPRLSPVRPAPPPPDSLPPTQEDEDREDMKHSVLSPSVSMIEETDKQRQERSLSETITGIKKRGRFNSVDCVGETCHRSKLIDVGGGPHSLPPKYHTIIQSISRSGTRIAGGTFSRRLRRSSSNSGCNNFTVLVSHRTAAPVTSSSTTNSSIIETESPGSKDSRIRLVLSP